MKAQKEQIKKKGVFVWKVSSKINFRTHTLSEIQFNKFNNKLFLFFKECNN